MKKVLLIDDDPVVISLYTALFHHNGFEVDTAADGEEGLVRLRQSRPCVVLLDLNMPKVNGLEWLRRVHAEGGAIPPIVILTTSEMSLLTQAARNAGAAEVLSKHRSDPDQVVESVVALLSRGN